MALQFHHRTQEHAVEVSNKDPFRHGESLVKTRDPADPWERTQFCRSKGFSTCPGIVGAGIDIDIAIIAAQVAAAVTDPGPDVKDATHSQDEKH